MKILRRLFLLLLSFSLFGCEAEVRLKDNQYIVGNDMMAPTIMEGAVITIEVINDISELNIDDIVAFERIAPDPKYPNDSTKTINITVTARIQSFKSFMVGNTTYHYFEVIYDNVNYPDNIYKHPLEVSTIIGRVIDIKNPSKV